MKAYVQDLKDITDSRELLEAKPPAVTVWFIYILIGIIVGAIVWSYFGEIENSVKAMGTVRPEGKAFAIKNVYSGIVKKSKLTDGKKVKKGDVLYTLELNNALEDKKSLENNISEMEIEDSNLQKLKDSIVNGKNLFNKNNQNEALYYDQYTKFELDLKEAVKSINNSEADIDQTKKESNLTIASAKEQLTQIQAKNNNQKLLESSIEQNKNLFSITNSEYYDLYNSYIGSLAKLELEKQSKLSNYNDLVKAYENKTANSQITKPIPDSTADTKSSNTTTQNSQVTAQPQITKDQVDKAKNELDIATLAVANYKNEYISNLRAGISENEKSISDLKLLISKSTLAIDSIGKKSSSKDLLNDKSKLAKIIEIQGLLKKNQTNLKKSKNDLAKLKKNMNKATVRASASGLISLYDNVNTGDALQNGATVGSIIPSDKTYYKVQIMVLNNDIANIKRGQKIKYQLAALPYQEYGEAEGKIYSIGTDARVDKKSGTSYYLAEATLKNTEMKSYKGGSKKIKVGMACQALVVTDTENVLKWALKKINILD